MKSVVFGARRTAQAGRDGPGSLEAALAPAFSEGRWRVPSRFNFTRDVVEVLARDPKRQALTCVGRDGIIVPRTFLQVAHGAARWAAYLREHGVAPGDRVLVAVGASPDWLEIVLAGIKVGAVTVPCSETLPAAALEIQVAAVGATVVVTAGRDAAVELAPPTGHVTVLSLDEARRQSDRLPKEGPTADTAGSDPALVVWTTGRTNGPRGAAHTHAATFAARLHATHWLDARPGDLVWCSAPPDSAQALWSSLFGPWSCGAEIVLSEESLDPAAEIELVRRLRVTTLCRTPGEYAVLVDSDRLDRLRSQSLRRIVATGNRLPEALTELVEERTGLVIQDGYGQAETGVIVAHRVDTASPRGSLGLPLPGYDVAVIDRGGRELPPGQLGDIALRGHPPPLFAGYWNAPASTKIAFRGDWYITGDVGTRDDAGVFWIAGRAGDVSAGGATLDASSSSRLVEPPPEAPEPAVDQELVRQVVDAAVVARPRTATADRPIDRAAPMIPVPAGSERFHTPLWARITGAIWLVLLGILVGGAAIPHASDEPRIAPVSGTPPNTICLSPAPRK